MDKATVTAQAATKDDGKAKGKETVQASNAVSNLRETLKAEATADLESKRSPSVSASASTGSSSSSSKLRGVYDGHKDDERLSRSSRDSNSSRKRSHSSRSESCSDDESRSRTRSRSRGGMDNLTNQVRFRGNDLDSAFGPRVFG
jgi:hypothetical protein